MFAHVELHFFLTKVTNLWEKYCLRHPSLNSIGGKNHVIHVNIWLIWQSAPTGMLKWAEAANGGCVKRGFLALVVVLEASQALRFYILIYLLCLIFSLPSPGTSRLMMGHNMKHITFTKTVTNYLKYKWYIPNSNGMQLNISPSPDVNSNLGEGGEKESNRIYIR